MSDERYTGTRAWAAEGARVALVTCLRCGAAILIDPSDKVDPLALHDAFHAPVDPRSEETP